MTSFENLGVPEHRIKALAALGILQPADIQIQAWPVLKKHQDAWLSSPTGSGKTFAYLLPLLEHIDTDSMDLQLVILAPTQELAVQIHQCLQSLYQGASAGKKPGCQLLIGGASIQRQKEKLKKKPHIAVGSCGRMLKLAGEKKLKLHRCRHVVIDEADKMMVPDRMAELEKLLDLMDSDRQIVFASATENGAAFEKAESLGIHVQRLQSGDTGANPKIDHYYLKSAHHHKSDTLRRLLHAVNPERAIVFLHRNETVDLVQLKLQRKGLPMVQIHGELSKFEREKALRDFRSGKAKILVSSDIASRGLDIKGVTHIINLDAPSNPKDYLHRVGRTGRMGAKGVAISILAPNEQMLLKRYESDLGIPFTLARLKEGKFLIEPPSGSRKPDFT